MSKKRNSRNNRILIAVTVVGSPGPIRLLVNAEESVEVIILRVLKIYVRQRRLPILAHDADYFYLYCANFVGGALASSEAVGCSGCRDFLMCKKPMESCAVIDDRKSIMRRKGISWKGISWKSWLNRSPSFTIFCLASIY